MANWLNKVPIAIVFLFILSYSSPIFAEDQICPPRQVHPNEPSELVVEESDFETQYDAALSYLKKGLPIRLEQGVENDIEVWINYENSVKVIEGYVLKQAALLEMERTGDKGSAVREFCSYLSNAYWVD